MSAGAERERPAGGGARRALAALVFGPPAAVAALRAGLAWQDGRHAPSPAFALAPLPASASAWALLLPWLLAALALVLLAAVLRLWWRRGGARAVRRVLAASWVLLWSGAAGALWVAHANTGQLQPLPDAQARVLGLRARAPTLHQMGGSEVVLGVDGLAGPPLAGPQRVRIEGDGAALWQPGQRLRVRLAQGRFYGLYLVGWEALGAAPAVQ